MAFADESDELFVGRFLALEEFPEWLRAQNMGGLPAIEGAIHHTYIPNQHQWHGSSSLLGVFNYYSGHLGWPRGVGPHFWVATGTDGHTVGIWVGTHPRHDGIGVAGPNHRRFHTEVVWDGDASPFGPEQLHAL